MGNNDSRTMFRDQIQYLVNGNVSDNKFDWDILFTTPITLTDVYSMVPDADIESLITNQKELLLELYNHCTSKLEDLLSLFDPKSPKLLFATNSIKLLIRIIPFLNLDGDTMWDHGKRSVKLTELSLKLLFIPGFTLSNKVQNSLNAEWDKADPSKLWEFGLGQNENREVTSSQTWENRSLVLRLILALNSSDLFRVHDRACANFCGLFVSSKANELATQLLYSVLNLVISANPLGYWKLPYSSFFSPESQESAIKNALQLLSLLTYMKFQNFEDVSRLTNAGVPLELLQDNAINEKISQISNQAELQMIYLGLKELIQIKIISQNTYLPGSVKDISYQNELLILFWVLLKNNAHFRVFLAQRPDIYELLPSLVDALKSVDYLVRSVSTYILLFLSTQRTVSCNLFHQFPNLTTDLPLFSGSYSDFLIISLSRYLLNSKLDCYKNLYPYFLMIISNISPFIKSVCPLASNNIVRLLEKYSKKDQLFESEKEHYNLFYILETVNNIISYQWNAAAGLILAILRKKDIVQKVFTLRSRWDDNIETNHQWLNEQWFLNWVEKLPLAVLQGVLNFFVPEVEKFALNNPNVSDESILNFILMNTLVGVIPPPGAIVIRNLEMNAYSEYFEYVHLWAFIYTCSSIHEIVPRNKIKLFVFSQ